MVKKIFIGDNLIDDIQKYDVILIGTSIKNSLSNGFQHDIATNFSKVDEINRKTKYDDPQKLGTCEVVSSYVKDGFPIFVICYITKGRYRPDIKPDALDYNALRSCLLLVNKNFKGKKVGTTLLGAEKYEGGGDSKEIYKIIDETCNDIELYIYDFVQKDFRKRRTEEYRRIGNERKNKLISREEYEEQMKKFLWVENFGNFFNPIPSDKSLYEIKKIIKNSKKHDQ